MPKLDSEFKNRIKSLSKTELETLVIKMAGKDKTFHDYLLVKYLQPEFGEDELFEEAKNDISVLFTKNFKGLGEQMKLAAMIEACSKRINEFDKICINKNLKADLMIMVLDEIFTYYKNLFGTCFTKFDYKTGLMLRSLVTLVTTKIHPDYSIEYKTKINEYLKALHNTSNHIDFIYSLPPNI